ncbi:FAD-dependent oxidoreductase [Rhizobium azibense]
MNCRAMTSAVLCAAGAWASSFLRMHAVSLPQASVRQTALRTGPAPDLGGAIYTSECALTRRIDGSYTIAMPDRFCRCSSNDARPSRSASGRSFFQGPETLGRWHLDRPTPFERIRVLDPAPDMRMMATIMARIKALFPAVADAGVVSSWGGYVDSTPDAIPVISPVESIGGVFVAAGCSGHGFGAGPGIGHLAADLVAGDAASVDPDPFRLSRFTDRSKIVIGAI